MAKLQIQWTDDIGIVCEAVTEQDLSEMSADLLFGCLNRIMKPLSTELRKLEAEYNDTKRN